MSLLFNTDYRDLFFEDSCSDFANFDNSAPYQCGPTLSKVMNNLEITIEKKFEGFSFNNFKVNAFKCHLYLFPYQSVPVNIRAFNKESSNCEKLLRIYVDNNFSFE